MVTKLENQAFDVLPPYVASRVAHSTSFALLILDFLRVCHLDFSLHLFTHLFIYWQCLRQTEIGCYLSQPITLLNWERLKFASLKRIWPALVRPFYLVERNLLSCRHPSMRVAHFSNRRSSSSPLTTHSVTATEHSPRRGRSTRKRNVISLSLGLANKELIELHLDCFTDMTSFGAPG